MNDKILILAAGNSSRLGENKQFLLKNGSTLLNRCINICRKAALGHISIVTGFQAGAINQMISGQNVNIIHNKNWLNGMGESIATGINSFDQSVSGVYIVLPDQIQLDGDILKKIKVAREKDPSKIVTSKYGEDFGAPTFFPSSYFDALRKCAGLNGAKQVITENLDTVKFIDFEGGEIDIDTPDELNRLD